MMCHHGFLLGFDCPAAYSAPTMNPTASTSETPLSPSEALAPTPAFSPLYQQIKGLILQGLQSGEWKPGEVIPSEIELAARYRVSQGTVRKAIDELAGDHLLVRRQGKGTFVATHSEHHVQYRFLKLQPDKGDLHSEGPAQREIVDCKRMRASAEVARALALRGWKVQVLAVQDHPASGASGVPAGLVSPTFSADDAPMAQLTRAGCALMRQHVQALLVQGRDWAPSGAWLRPVPEDPAQAAREARHVPEAFWLQPAALVRAWLATPGITFTGRTRVNRLERLGEHWVCLDKDGLELARSELVVVANALDAARLLGQPDPTMPGPGPTPAMTQALAGLHPRYGAVSMGASAGLDGLPAQPVQGQGNFLPSVPTAQGAMWLAGAGFDSAPAPDPQVHHHANLARLQRLLPDVAATLAPQFASGDVQLWQGQRCVSHDRLPLVGAVQAAPDPSLWISAAMGARGLTLAALCAELLAARIGGEPLPLPARLARLLDVQRAPRQSLIR